MKIKIFIILILSSVFLGNVLGQRSERCGNNCTDAFNTCVEIINKDREELITKCEDEFKNTDCGKREKTKEKIYDECMEKAERSMLYCIRDVNDRPKICSVSYKDCLKNCK